MTAPRFLPLAFALALAGGAAAQTGILLSSISPSQVAAGSGAFLLTVSGRGFTQVSGCAAPVILWTVGQAEAPLTPTTVGANGTLASALVPASLVAQQASQTVFIRVRTQYLGGSLFYSCVNQDSNALPFQITASLVASCNNPPPARAGQSYSHALAVMGGTPPYVWTPRSIAPQVSLASNGVISGTFSQSDGPAVTFTAVVRDSAFVNDMPTSTQVTCQIQVQSLAPVISAYTPADATACGPGFTLTVAGANFEPGAQLGLGPGDVYNRIDTTVLSPASLSGRLAREQISTPGLNNLVAGNPAATAAGYVFSDPRPFNIRRTPVARTLNPARVVAGGGDLRVAITGSDLVPGLTRVLWQAGTASEQLAPVQISPAELVVMAPARLLATAGSALLRVVNVEPANPRGEPYLDTCSPPLTFNVEAVTLQLGEGQLPAGRVGVEYRTAVSATGGARPYVFSVLSGSVPGLSLASDGVLSGRPTQAGAYTLRVQVTDASSPPQRAQRDFPLRIDPPALAITAPGTLADATVGANYSATFSAAGGTPPYRWTVPAVPGLTLGADGVLSGRPTQAGSFTLVVQVTDNSSPALTAERSYSLRVNPPTLAVAAPAPGPLPAGMLGADYSVSFTASGGTAPYTWGLQSGSVPGLALTSGGTLGGRPTGSGNFTLVVRVTDAADIQATRQYTLAVGLSAANLTLAVPTPPASPTDQPTLTLRLSSAYPAALEGRLTLSFAPNASGLPAGYMDPAVRFSSGGTTLAFSVPASATTVTLPGNGAVQTGTVAGTITVTLDQLRLAGTTTDVPLASRPSVTVAVARAAPSIVANSVQITSVTGSGFAVELDAYSTPRDLRAATFNFLSATGTRLEGSTSFTVQLTTEAATWFDSATGRNNGSRFHLRVPFTLSGNANALGSVSVTLENSAGSSAPSAGGVR